jgi:hypothetical protein
MKENNRKSATARNHSPPPAPHPLFTITPTTFRLPPPRAGDPFFGLSRAAYYKFEAEGLLKLIRICSPGKQRGITLVNYADVAALVQAHKEAQ